MKLLTLCICLCLALVSFSHISAELGTVKALDLAIFPAMYVIPVIVGVLSFLILTIRSKAGLVTGSRNVILLLLRLSFVAIIWGLVWMAPDWYRRSKVTSIPVNAATIEKMNWQQFQSVIDFKVVRVTDASGSRICFAKAEGRQQQLRSTLEKFEHSMSGSGTHGP